MKAIEKVQDEMKQGNVQKVVLARELKVEMDHHIDSALVLEALRIGQPVVTYFLLIIKEHAS